MEAVVEEAVAAIAAAVVAVAASAGKPALRPMPQFFRRSVELPIELRQTIRISPLKCRALSGFYFYGDGAYTFDKFATQLYLREVKTLAPQQAGG
jgi:hypothetical protein